MLSRTNYNKRMDDVNGNW